MHSCFIELWDYYLLLCLLIALREPKIQTDAANRMNHAIKLLLSPVFADLEADFFPASALPVSFVSFCATVRVVSAEPSVKFTFTVCFPAERLLIYSFENVMIVEPLLPN